MRGTASIVFRTSRRSLLVICSYTAFASSIGGVSDDSSGSVKEDVIRLVVCEAVRYARLCVGPVSVPIDHTASIRRVVTATALNFELDERVITVRA